MESTEPDASAPMGLWEFARHIRTTTVTGTTTVRLVVPTDLTERGALDLTGLRSLGGQIRGDKPAAATSKEPQLVGIWRWSPRVSAFVSAAIGLP
jgi:hypothetical protein